MNSFCKDGLNKKARSGNLDFEGLQDVYLNFLSEMTKQLSSPNMNLPSDHTKIEGFHETIDEMSKKLTARENQIASLQQLFEEKDKQMGEIKKQMKAMQTETDATIIEKFELESKIQDMKKETNEQKNKIAELLNGNQEISESLHNREEKLACLEIEVVQAVKALAAKEAENGKLMHQVEKSEMEIKSLKEFEKRYKLTKSKLCDAEYELKQREEALERLANHLAATVEGNLCENSLEAAGQFLVSLKWNEKR